MKRTLDLLLCFLAISISAPAATYYVDFSGGNDANTGTSVSAPWQHHPYMRGWIGNYNHQPGDRFIFKGGVTWPSTSFSMNITEGGSSAAPDYYGADPAWYSGASWSRPVFDLQRKAPTGGKAAIQVSTSFVTIDNLDIKNLFIPGGDTFEASSIAIVYQHDILIKNCLIHEWTTSSSIDDQMGGVTAIGSTNITVDHSVIYGTIVNGNKTMGACTFNVDTVRYSSLYNCSTGTFGSVDVHDNSIHDIGQSNDSSYHENAMEVGGASVIYVYNNLVYNCNHGTCVYPNPGNGSNVASTMYVFNNVVYNSVIPNIEVDMWGETSATTNLYVYNNTLHCPGGNCVRIVPSQGAALTNLYVRNNHYISDDTLTECWNNAGGNSSCGAVSGTAVSSNNVLTSTATATLQGYTANDGYAPVSSSASTRGAGLNVTSSCASMGSALCSDTSLGSTRTPVARPASGSWDSGAYQYGGSVAPSPSLSGIACSPTTLQTPGSATCSVTLTSAAPASGTTVSLSSSHTALAVPATLMVPAGAQSAAVPATASATTTNTLASVTASVNGGALSSTITLLPPVVVTAPALSNLTLSTTSMVSGTTATGTVTLSAPAPAGGIPVALSTSNPAAASPASSQVVVPQGSFSATFGITTSGVSTSTSLVLSATYNGVTRNANLTVTPASTGPVPTGLIAAYSFSEGTGTQVADKSGKGNAGTISGATWTTGGRFGSALSFNGTKSWVTVKDSASLDLTTAVSMEAWVYPKALSGWGAVLVKERSGGLCYALYANSDPGTPAGTVRTSYDVNLYGSTGLTLNAWNHLAATYDGSVLRLYVNGILVNSQSLTGKMPVSTGVLRIGGDSVWGEYFNGLIDEVRIYNRSLSAAEIAADMKTPL